MKTVIDVGPGGEQGENEGKRPEKDADRNIESFLGGHRLILSRTRGIKNQRTKGIYLRCCLID